MVWEQRWHPLREEWVAITSHRNTRPWSGPVESGERAPSPALQPGCHLCPGNTRISGKVNDRYEGLYVFDNDHPSFSAGAPEPGYSPGIYRNSAARGVSRVVCYAPQHNLTLAELPLPRLRELLHLWCAQTRELAAKPEINQVFIFENKGEVVGVSNAHPHGQIYATNILFKDIERELLAQQKYHVETGRHLFGEIIDTECKDGRRLIVDREHAVAFVPWFARFPYETWIAPTRPVQFLDRAADAVLDDLALALKEVLVRFDNLWQMSFPYMMVLHQAPTDGRDYPAYHFHIQLLPPLRRPGLQKFLASAETGGGIFLNDACPEDTAAELLAVATRHYRLDAESP